MIVAAVVCPHPPLLLRELSGTVDAVPQLRAACLRGISRALEPRPDVVVAVGGDETTGEWDAAMPVDVRRFGTTTAPHVAGVAGLPQSLGVAKRLLEESGWEGPVRMHAVARDAGHDGVAAVAHAVRAVEGRVVLLVMGDGSARRGERAPGHLDERAFGFDDEVASALERGDAEALVGLDPVLGGELMALGRAAWAVLGQVVARSAVKPRPEVLYRGDPFGVQYHVVSWDLS